MFLALTVTNKITSGTSILSILVCRFCSFLYPPGGRVGNTLTWHAINPGSVPGRGIHSDSDDHYNSGPVSLDPQ